MTIFKQVQSSRSTKYVIAIKQNTNNISLIVIHHSGSLFHALRIQIQHHKGGTTRYKLNDLEEISLLPR